ncbi:EamA family transporter [Streptomyces sp. S1A(2023)]
MPAPAAAGLRGRRRWTDSSPAWGWRSSTSGSPRLYPAGGLWPIAAGRLAAVLLLLPNTWRHARHFRQRPQTLTQAAVIGGGAALGLSLYLLAAHQQMLAVAVVLASLYPAIPTVLGLVALHEKVSRKQVAGLLAAGVAIILLSLG